LNKYLFGFCVAGGIACFIRLTILVADLREGMPLWH
jgi:hypothetical protein